LSLGVVFFLLMALGKHWAGLAAKAFPAPGNFSRINCAFLQRILDPTFDEFKYNELPFHSTLCGSCSDALWNRHQ
jgi:hypothetical protein